jgi:pSer/pThr/pTyr-binding forkhead associated (FHA) protein
MSETPVPSKPLDDDPVRREVAERVLETAAELERLIKGKSEPPKPSPALVNSDATNNGATSGEKLLYITSDDGELLKVAKERFLIGRGKHCDFVINSGKVSREHAAIVRDGPEFFIEDLGSSNGTWFNKQRIKRRKIEDGDEYFICSEKVRCLFR